MRLNWRLAIVNVLFVTSAFGAEIQLRGECRPKGRVVTLGDVAEVFAEAGQADDRLAATELLPTPTSGEQRTLEVREVQDLLSLRGVNLAEHRFTGLRKVTIGAAAEAPRAKAQRGMSAASRQQAAAQIRRAVEQYVQKRNPDLAESKVDLDLADEQARTVAAARGSLTVRGGAAPWSGVQQFEITCDTPQGPVELAVEANVAEPRGVVVTARSLSRGAVVHESDLTIEPARPGQAEGFASIDDAVGKEVTRAVPAGQVLDPQSVRSPILVRRNELVTIYARGAGIQVHTTARSREDAGLGELVTVESLHDRKGILARVSGSQEVEVFGQGVRVAGDEQDSAKPARAARPTKSPSASHLSRPSDRPPQSRAVQPASATDQWNQPGSWRKAR